MGSNREIDSNESANEVQQTITKEFGVSKQDLYTVWLGYTSRLTKNMSRIDAIQIMRLNPYQYSNNALNAFIAIGLESITFDMIDNKQLSLGVE